MPIVQGDEDIRLKTLRHGDYRGVRAAQREVRVPFYEIGNARPVLGDWRLDVEALKAAKEAGLYRRPLAAVDKVSRFSHTKGRDYKVKPGILECRETGAVGRISSIGDRDQRAAIHDRDRDHPPIRKELRPSARRGSSPDR